MFDEAGLKTRNYVPDTPDQPHPPYQGGRVMNRNSFK
jgi:hypothetical protein